MPLYPVAYQGAVATEDLPVIVRQGDNDTDLTTATGAEMRVQLPTGDTATWAADLSDATTSSVTVTHVYEDGDLPVMGRYVVVVVLTVPDGVVRSKPFPLQVLGPFECP